MVEFKCQKCGYCCTAPAWKGMQLTASEALILKRLAREKLRLKLKYKMIYDGVYRLQYQDCPFFDFETNLCIIYDQRPLVCRMFPYPELNACVKLRDPYKEQCKVFIIMPTAKEVYLKTDTAKSNWLIYDRPNTFSVFTSDASTAAQARNIGIKTFLTAQCTRCGHKWMNGWERDNGSWKQVKRDDCPKCGSKAVLEQFKHFTHVLFWDSDVWFEDNILKSLWEAKKDVISPLVYKRTTPHHPMFYHKMGEANYAWFVPNGEEDLMEIDAASASFLLIERKVIETVPPPWFEYPDMLANTGGEDLYFCDKIKQHGFEVWGSAKRVACHLVENETPRTTFTMDNVPSRITKVQLPAEKKLSSVDKGLMKIAEYIQPERGWTQMLELYKNPAENLALEYVKKVKEFENTPQFEMKLLNFYSSTPHYIFDLYKAHQHPGRQKWTRYIEQKIYETEGIKTICDYGGGIGCDLINLRHKYECTLAELNSHHLSFAKHWGNGTFKLISIQPRLGNKLPNFDVILCLDVLEHVIEPLHLLEQFARHANKLIFLSDTFFKNELYPQHLEANLKLKGKLGDCLRGLGIKEVIENPKSGMEQLPLIVGVK